MNCNNNKELRIVRGNAFSIKIHVEAVRLDGTKVEDFDLSQSSAILKLMPSSPLTVQNCWDGMVLR